MKKFYPRGRLKLNGLFDTIWYLFEKLNDFFFPISVLLIKTTLNFWKCWLFSVSKDGKELDMDSVNLKKLGLQKPLEKL